MHVSEPGPLLRFHDYVLDPVSEELSRNGVPLPLSPQPVRVLALLAANSGRMVRREEIQRHVWGGAHVEADLGLNSCIRKIRAQLGDDPNDPQFIQTLPRRGYRFLAPVENGSATDRNHRFRPWWLAAVVTVAALAATLGAYLSRNGSDRAGASVANSANVVAVLPFDELSSGSEALSGSGVLGEGIAEETITRLGGVDPSRLAVLARTTALQLDGDDSDPLEASREVGADYVLQGSVKRTDAGLRLNVRLSETRSGLQVAAESFDSGGTELPTQVALADRVAAWLVVRLAPELAPPASAPPRLRAELYELYLQGLHELSEGTGEGYLAARERFAAVVAEEPTATAAWLGLAEAELWLSWFGADDPAAAVRRARTAAERALELDPERALAYALLGYADLYIEFDLERAGRRLARAATLEPGSSRAQSWYASYLSAIGAHDEAIERARLARQLDPLSMGVGADLCWLLNYARRFDEALTACDAALALQAGDPWTTMGKLESLRQLTRNGEAVELVSSLAAAAGEETLADEWRRRSDGDPRAALDEGLAWLEARTRRGPQSFHAASIAAARGRVPEALDLLDAASEGAEMLVVFIGVDPRFDSLRAEPAFQSLLNRLGLPART